MRFVVVAFVAACGSKPPPKPPPAELDVNGLASFAGSWVTADDMDFGYRLKIGADGGYVLTIERGKLGKCDQKGTLAATDNPRKYTIAYALDTCDPDYKGGSIGVQITSFIGSALTVVTSFDGVDRKRIYQRDPSASVE